MNWAQDIRYAFRMIRKSPWLSTAVVLTIALGIGANTTVFTLVNAALYKPLPFPGGERLVLVRANNLAQGRDSVNISYADVRDFRQSANTFEYLEAFGGQAINLSEPGNPPQRYRGGRTTAGLFDMLRVRPVLGRSILPSDEKPGAEQVLLLGYQVWADRYGRDPKVIGHSVRVNEKPATVIGVMPEGFKFPNNEDLWAAAVPDAELERRSNRAFLMIGMLKPDASIPEALAEFGSVAKRLEEQFPDSHKGHGVSVQTFHQAMNGGRIRLVFLLMLGAVGFVLLIACANVANMLLSRAIGRTREISIRAAMGASRWRVIRQLLVESLILSMVGGALGLCLAVWGVHAFSMAVENVGKPYWVSFAMDYVVFGYFAAVTLLAGLFFGIAPALQASRVDLNETLKEGARSAGGVRTGYLSGALVVFQFTLAVVLLSGAGLMIRSFLLAQDEFSSLDAEQILHARVNLPSDRYPKPEERQRFFEKLIPQLASLPGAENVSMVSNPPGMGSAGWRVEIEGRAIAQNENRPAVAGIVASPGYFRLLGIPLLRGREFDETDGLPGKEGVVVTQQFVARFFPNEDPLGKRVRLFGSDSQAKPSMTIVGVVPDLRQNDPSGPSNDPVVMVPYRSESYSSMAILVRSQGTVTALAPAFRSEVQQLDGELPLFDVGSLEEWFQRGRWHLRVFGTTFFIFALIAMGMAAVGIYGVMAHSTVRRTREIGVRLALGADTSGILKLVLGRGAKQLLVGMVLGLAAAIAVCRLMAGLLFKVSPQDPFTFAGVTLVLCMAGLAACWLPARRAAKLDPVKALRYE
jgi:predicted permease